MAGNERNEIPVALTGMGMMTPVGHSAPISCASIRGGISRLEAVNEFPAEEFFIYEEDIVEAVGCQIKGLTNGHLGVSRFSSMALPAFKEALTSSRIDLRLAGQFKILLALPNIDRPGRDERLEILLIRRMANSIGVKEEALDVKYIYSGHASACVALQMAHEFIAKGKVAQVVVGGVESLLEPPTLIWLEKEGRIKSDSNVDGFNPGEASFFLVVETEENARKRNTEIFAYLKGIAVTTEQNSILSKKYSTSVGLGETLSKTLQCQQKEIPINMIICDMNGERYRSIEWGNTVVRSLKGVKGTLNLWHHADCIGDTGVASAGISIIFGATAINKGYAEGKHVLVWASSDDGTRGSLIVEGTDNEER